MADDLNRASRDSRKSFLSSFDDVEKFLEASESVEEDVGNKTTDIEITTDLGSSTSMLSPTSPMPFLSKSLEGKLQHQDPIAEEVWDSEALTSPKDKDLHSDTPLPHADTPLPDPEANPVSSKSASESSDELTVHHESDSLNTEALKLMAGVKSSNISTENPGISFTKTDDASERPKNFPTFAVEDGSSLSAVNPPPKESPGLLSTAKKESNLLDKVSFMESSVPNNTALMATGASIADLPLEEDFGGSSPEKNSSPVIREETPAELISEEAESEVRASEVEEEVEKILQEVKSSEREYSSDQFESEEDDSDTSDRPKQLTLTPEAKSPAKTPFSPMKTTLNPFESTPINIDRFQDQSAGFDLSPVRDPQKSTVEEEQKKETKSFEGKPNISQDTLSTTNPDYSQEKDMAYYLAKIKAKAAQKSQEIRSSIESSRASATDSKSEKTPDPEFVKPKTPVSKKKPDIKKAGASIKKPATSTRSSGPVPTKRKIPVRTAGSKSKIVAQSPVAAYIRGKPNSSQQLNITDDNASAIAKLSKQQLGNTWTCALTDKSLVEVIQSDGDVEAWKELYKRTQGELAQVQEQLQETQRAHKERISTLKAAHSQELHKYKQDVYVLQSRVKSAGTAAGAAAGDTDSRVEQLNKQIAELENLLSGYQTENVKLYEEMRGLKENQKEEITRLYLENKDLAANNVALKQLLEQKEATVRQLQQKQQTQVLAEKVSNLPKLAALQAELDDYKHREIMYKQRIVSLEGAGGGGPREFNDVAVNSSLIEVDHQITSLIKEHTAERDQLYEKLENLLRENAELRTDKDLLRRREERIAELQHSVKLLQSSEHEQKLVATATADNLRTISDLKRQVAELESALHKRHPDSIAALIAATQPPDNSTKIQEMQETLVRVRSEYEEHIAKLKSEKSSEVEMNKLQQMNRVLREKVTRLEETLSTTQARAEKSEQEARDLREGQIPTGEIKRKMEQLNDKLRLQDQEMVQLKSKLLLTAPLPKQYNPEQFEGKHVSEVRKENSILKTKCDLLKIENDQHKSSLLGMKVTHEAELMRLAEEHSTKTDKLIQIHEGEKQKLVTQHAARFAESEVARLTNKVDTLELQVSHYSEQAAQLPKLQNETQTLRNKEKTLVEQITKLGRELEEAAAQQPPSIHQYKTIQQRVENMERNHKNQISELQDTIQKLEKDKVKVVIADEHIIKKYKEQLIEKNLQIERFQSEIDSIISLCMELQSHGVVLPKKSKLGQFSV